MNCWCFAIQAQPSCTLQHMPTNNCIHLLFVINKLIWKNVICASDVPCLQEAVIHTQQTQHSEADTKLQGQLHLAQGRVASLEAQLATASEAASQSQLMQSLQLKKLSEQHSSMLTQLKLDHEIQLKAATEHHEVSIQLLRYSLMTCLYVCSCCLHDCAPAISK